MVCIVVMMSLPELVVLLREAIWLVFDLLARRR